jgi:hypothetical protein
MRGTSLPGPDLFLFDQDQDERPGINAVAFAARRIALQR